MIIPYLEYHEKSYEIGDIDPAYPMLQYICNRFELNVEQRYWLAFLYGCCYCGSTVYYIYNEFPDFENVDIGRMERWWNANKNKLLFQTDRLRIKSNNQFIPAVRSYQKFVKQSSLFEGRQEDVFTFITDVHADSQVKYDYLYQCLLKDLAYFGRYSLFLYLECMHWLTGINISPTSIDWNNADNCREGLLLANNFPVIKTLLLKRELDQILNDIINTLKGRHPERRTDIWNVETTLCAYKKYRNDKRWIGYYIQRQQKEIDTMAQNVPSGVCWDVLYDFRKEYFKPEVLKQFS